MVSAPRPTETQLHIALADWLKLPTTARRLRCIWWHTDNTHSNPARAKQLERMGMRAGVPDFLFLNNDTRVAFIELKRRGGHLNDDQRTFRQWIDARAFPYALISSDDTDIILSKAQAFLERHEFMSGV